LFTKPRVVISKCIEFEPVRYNGQIISSDFVRELIKHVEAIPVCPEVGIGLSVPRDTLRLVKIGEDIRLIQPKTRNDYTDEMKSFAENFFNELGEVDGFIMRSSSPSSGITRVKIYSGIEKSPMLGFGRGIFGGMILEKYGNLAVEEDLRLKHGAIREHFLRKLYILSDFRAAKQEKTMKKLVDFHTRNKLQLKAYNQKQMRILGRIVANHEHHETEKLYGLYEPVLHKALKRASRYTSYINVLMNSLGYFSRDLTSGEKQFFLKQLELYREGRIPLVVPVDIMRSWIIRTEEKYLGDQTFFKPYPEELMDVEAIVEARGERDYWKNLE